MKIETEISTKGMYSKPQACCQTQVLDRLFTCRNVDQEQLRNKTSLLPQKSGDAVFKAAVNCVVKLSYYMP